jgi:hypothetical protein
MSFLKNLSGFTSPITSGGSRFSPVILAAKETVKPFFEFLPLLHLSPFTANVSLGKAQMESTLIHIKHIVFFKTMSFH